MVRITVSCKMCAYLPSVTIGVDVTIEALEVNNLF